MAACVVLIMEYHYYHQHSQILLTDCLSSQWTYSTRPAYAVTSCMYYIPTFVANTSNIVSTTLVTLNASMHATVTSS